jgi:hypothetical protein
MGKKNFFWPNSFHFLKQIVVFDENRFSLNKLRIFYGKIIGFWSEFGPQKFIFGSHAALGLPTPVLDKAIKRQKNVTSFLSKNDQNRSYVRPKKIAYEAIIGVKKNSNYHQK